MIEPAHNTVMIISPNTPGTYLTKGYFGKKAKKGKKETEKKENMEWDTGFGEIYESIGDRKTKKLFPEITDLLE
jgi:hypothetical protein